MTAVEARRIWKTVITGSLSATLAFWIPSILLHALSPNFGTLGEPLLILTFILPLSVFSAILIFRGDHPHVSAMSSLAGIWLSGPACMMISATFTGGGFCQADAWKNLVFATIAFPVFTFMMSAYDGTLLALVLTTASVPILLGILSIKSRDRQA